MLQAIDATNAQHLERMYGLLAEQLGSTKPDADFQAIANGVAEFEHEYGVIRVVRKGVLALISHLPDLRQIFDPSPAHRMASGDVSDIVLDKMRPHLETLQQRGMLNYAIGSNKLVFGSGGGNRVELKIQVQEAYYDIATQVMA